MFVGHAFKSGHTPYAKPSAARTRMLASRPLPTLRDSAPYRLGVRATQTILARHFAVGFIVLVPRKNSEALYNRRIAG